MGTRRRSRRRRRRPAEEPAPAATDGPSEDEPSSETESSGGYGKAALVLALLLGILIEQIASDVIPTEALDIFHLAVLVGIAFFVARWYRGTMRRALNRRRANRDR